MGRITMVNVSGSETHHSLYKKLKSNQKNTQKEKCLPTCHDTFCNVYLNG